MWTTAVALALLGAPTGQETTDAAEAFSPDDVRAAFVELEDEYDEARQDWMAEVRASYEEYEAQGDTSARWERPDPIEPDWYPRFVELADLGSPDATLWCIQNHSYSGLKAASARKDKSARYLLMLSEERSDAVLIQVAYALMGDGQMELMNGDAADGIGREAAFRFLDVVDRMTESDDVHVTTLFARGQSLIRYGATAEESKDGLVYYRKAAKDYPDTDIGKRCGGMVFSAENLQIGQKAPNIQGKAHDGSDLALADFAGKVTVIDFWGFW